jgi:hypothetical protein
MLEDEHSSQDGEMDPGADSCFVDRPTIHAPFFPIQSLHYGGPLAENNAFRELRECLKANRSIRAIYTMR